MNIAVNIVPPAHLPNGPHEVGYWGWDNNTLIVLAAELPNLQMSWCLVLHELIEAALCYVMYIPQRAVDEFDEEWHATHPRGSHAEPGDEPDAPYCPAHIVASICERAIAYALGVNWNQYERAIDDVLHAANSDSSRHTESPR